MMHALAKFIMRGRLHASVLALLSVPLISHAAIALVTLRKGSHEGFFMIAVALAPTVVALGVGRASSAIFLMTVINLAVIYAPAVCLRATRSWAFTLHIALVTSIVAVLTTISVSPELLESFIEMIEQLSAAAQVSEVGIQLDATVVSGSIVLGMLLSSLTGLLLARWWQALLYNPGGFGEEFRQIRLSSFPSLLYVVAIAICYMQGANYAFWGVVFAVPLIVVGLAIVHSFSKARNIGREWLIALYVLIVAYNQFFLLLLAAAGFIDSWLNMRNRWFSSNRD